MTQVIDVDEATFQREVVERSSEVPVVVDFWAAWCGPCRTLGPMLEEAVAGRNGAVVLAKVDVDANQRLAQAFRVQGIPAVKAFRDGAVVDEFVGAQPRQAIEAFLDRVVPSDADRAVEDARQSDPVGAEALYRHALGLEPDHREAALGLAGLIVERAPDEAVELVTPHRPHPDAETIVTRAELARGGAVDTDDLRDRLEADPQDTDSRLRLARGLAAEGLHDEAVDVLLEGVRLGGDAREASREQLVALLQIVREPEVVADARKRLAAALF